MRGPPLHGQPRQLAPRCVLPPPHPGWRPCARVRADAATDPSSSPPPPGSGLGAPADRHLQLACAHLHHPPTVPWTPAPKRGAPGPTRGRAGRVGGAPGKPGLRSGAGPRAAPFGPRSAGSGAAEGGGAQGVASLPHQTKLKDTDSAGCPGPPAGRLWPGPRRRTGWPCATRCVRGKAGAAGRPAGRPRFPAPPRPRGVGGAERCRVAGVVPMGGAHRPRPASATVPGARSGAPGPARPENGVQSPG